MPFQSYLFILHITFFKNIFVYRFYLTLFKLCQIIPTELIKKQSCFNSLVWDCILFSAKKKNYMHGHIQGIQESMLSRPFPLIVSVFASSYCYQNADGGNVANDMKKVACRLSLRIFIFLYFLLISHPCVLLQIYSTFIHL